jgi:hypothetical protein
MQIVMDSMEIVLVHQIIILIQEVEEVEEVQEGMEV